MSRLCIAFALALASLSAQTRGNVTLPLDDYNKLVELAAKPPKKPDTPPFPYVLKSEQLNLTVNGESASGTIVIEGEVLAKGLQKVQLAGPSTMVVFDIQQKSGDLSVIRDNGGILTALIEGPREFVLTLNVAIPLRIETGQARFVIPLSPVGSATAAISVPGENTYVDFLYGVATSRVSRGGRTLVEAVFNSSVNPTVFWASRTAAPPTPVAAPPKPVRFLSDVKTLISVTDFDVSLAALAEINVVQGEPEQFTVLAPAGYELTGATGPTLGNSAPDSDGKAIRLLLTNSGVKNHQFLISMVKSNTGTKADVPLPTFEGAQRETGEVLIEAEGAIDLHATERGGLRRMDSKETSPFLRSLGHAPVHAAFRYQKKPADLPGLALEWTRFPDSSVLSAVAQQAVVTTLVTVEGRSLTEVKLTLKNQSQPFLKVGLPAGATILSADVAGEKVKPVQGADGNRVPLLRSGFRPKDSYTVSFVFLHAGAPFEKKGGAELALPKMDIPVGLMQWEVFLPKQFKVSDFGGDAVPAASLPLDPESSGDFASPSSLEISLDKDASSGGGPGILGGTVVDSAGAVVANALVTAVHTTTGASQAVRTNSSGRWSISGLPTGRLTVTVESPGFRRSTRVLDYDATRGGTFQVALDIGSSAESVMVNAQAPAIPVNQAGRAYNQNAVAPDLGATANVAELQRRVVGVLPIAVNVPHTGNSYKFVRPLTVDEETKLTFTYRTGK